MCEYAFNESCLNSPAWSGEEYAFLKDGDMLEFHRSLPGYEPTPLRELPDLAFRLGLGAIFVKDESRRFGIKAFKALGASYAIYRFLKAKLARPCTPPPSPPPPSATRAPWSGWGRSPSAPPPTATTAAPWPGRRKCSGRRR